MALPQGADPRGVPERDLPRPARRPRRARRGRRRPRVLPQGDPPAHARRGQRSWPGWCARRTATRPSSIPSGRWTAATWSWDECASSGCCPRPTGRAARAEPVRAAGDHRGPARALLHGLRPARARAALRRRDRERRRSRVHPRSILSCSASPRRRSSADSIGWRRSGPRLGRADRRPGDCRRRWWRSTRPPARSARSSADATTRSSQYNRALLARRQPGSAFKPFVYPAALRAQGGARWRSPRPPSWTTLRSPHGRQHARGLRANYGDRYEGRVIVRRAGALAQRRDGAGGREGRATRRDRDGAQPRSRESARRGAGDRARRIRDDTARAGSRVSSARQRRSAGRPRCSRCTPSTIATAPSIPATPRRPSRRSRPPRPTSLTSLLEGVIPTGTATAVRSLGVTGAVAGKTGTTNDGRDAWFVGYTPRLLTVVWIGFDGGDAHGLSGAEAALPVWADFMRQAVSRPRRRRPSTCRAASASRRSTWAMVVIANRFCPGGGTRDVPGWHGAGRLRRALGA